MVSDKVAIQLKRCTCPADVRISSKLSDVKPLHSSWIVDFYEHMFQQSKILISGLNGTDANEAKPFLESVENPFTDA